MSKKISTDDELFELETGSNMPVSLKGAQSREQAVELMFWIDEKKRNLPLAELYKRGLVDEENKDFSLFSLLSNSYSDFSVPLFRASGDKVGDEESKQRALVITWLSVVCEKAKAFDLARFEAESLGDDFLKEIAKLSQEPNVISEIPGILAEKGIGLVYEKAFERAKVDGATFISKHGNPIIGLSIRYDRLDNFWFTLLHELAHIIYHRDLLDNPLVYDLESESLSVIEKEANFYAREAIIPKKIWRRCALKSNMKVENVHELAENLGVHPALVVGRLHYETGRYSLFREIVDSNSVRKIVGWE